MVTPQIRWGRDTKDAQIPQELNLQHSKQTTTNHFHKIIPSQKSIEKPLELPPVPVDKWEELHMANILRVPDVTVQHESK